MEREIKKNMWVGWVFRVVGWVGSGKIGPGMNWSTVGRVQEVKMTVSLGKLAQAGILVQWANSKRFRGGYRSKCKFDVFEGEHTFMNKIMLN